MKDYEDNWEQQINDLLDGELSELEAEQLKTAAKDNAELAGKIVDAYQLQQLMAGLPEERAPASLTERLLAVPAEQEAYQQAAREASEYSRQPKERRSWFQPRWAMALAAVPLAIIAVTMWQPNEIQPGVAQPGVAQSGKAQPGIAPSEAPTEAEVEQARLELAIAFAYLDKAGRITSQEIENQVGDTMTDAIAGSVIRNVRSQYEISKESNT